MAEHDLAGLSIDGQLELLMEGTYFADEGGLVDSSGSMDESSGAGVPASDKENYQDASDKEGVQGRTPHANGGLRAQMRAELKAKLELSAKLKAKGAPDWPLRVYIGADPTRTSLHIGHMVPVVFMRRFQQLGHQVIFLIGDYTATIGDPSGASKERDQLTHERVMELSRFYTGQAHRLLHEDTREVAYPGGTVTELGAEVRYNGEWLAGLTFAQTAELAAQFPLGQVIARQDFRNRMESGAGVRLHECLYMLMQGFDAYALNCDVQVGGYDQHFNLLAGRILQKHFAEKLGREPHPLYSSGDAAGLRVRGPHVMLTCPLLMGTDGRKMSKSWGNTIDVLDEPHDIYGKVMRISDEMIAHYIDIAVPVRQAEKEEWKARIAGDPMGVKKWVAQSITALYCGDDAADAAAEHFQRTVQERSFSEDDIEEVDYASIQLKHGGTPIELGVLITLLEFAPSKSEARRLISQGGVRLNDEKVSDPRAMYEHNPGTILQVGKRKIVKLV